MSSPFTLSLSFSFLTFSPFFLCLFILFLYLVSSCSFPHSSSSCFHLYFLLAFSFFSPFFLSTFLPPLSIDSLSIPSPPSFYLLSPLLSFSCPSHYSTLALLFLPPMFHILCSSHSFPFILSPHSLLPVLPSLFPSLTL